MRRRRNLDAMLMTTTLILVAAVLVVLSVRIITNSDVRDQAVFVPFGDLTKPDTIFSGQSGSSDEADALIDRRCFRVDDMVSSDIDAASAETEVTTTEESAETTAPTTEESASTDATEPATTAATVKPTSGTTTTAATTSKTTTTRDPEAFESVDIRYYANSENGLNLREKPSTKAPVLRKLDYGTPLRVIGLNSEWAKVRLAGYEIGYVSRDFITKYRPVTEPPTTTTTTAKTTTTTKRTTGTTTKTTTKTTKITTAPTTTTPPATTVPPSATTTAPPSSQSSLTTKLNGVFQRGYAAEVLRLVNEKRAAAGLNPLSLNQSLTQSAEVRSTELPIKIGHYRPDGSYYRTAIKIPYRRCSEIIAWGYTTPERVVNGWYNSSAHRRNMMRDIFTETGVSCYVVNGYHYWVMHFIQP